MSRWFIVAKLKEYFKYKGQKREIKYKYQPTLIEESFKDDLEEITQLYFKIFQLNRNDDCELSTDVKRLIIGPIKTYNIIPLIETNIDQEIQNVINYLYNLEIIHNKYFVINNHNDIHLSIDDLSKKKSEIIMNIKQSLTQINKVSSYKIDLTKEPQILRQTLSNNIYSFSEITMILIKLLELLKKEINDYVEEKDKYYKKYPKWNYFKCPKFRKWNYQQFIDNQIGYFKNFIEIKFSQIEKERKTINIIIDLNLQNALQTPDPNIKKNFCNQAVINLKTMYADYRNKKKS